MITFIGGHWEDSEVIFGMRADDDMICGNLYATHKESNAKEERLRCQLWFCVLLLGLTTLVTCVPLESVPNPLNCTLSLRI